MKNLTKIPGYELVFSDEFEGSTPNPSNWNLETHPAGWVNGELQDYRADPDVVFISDGKLHIRPVREVSPEGNVKYSCGRLNTSGKKEFQYGRFEARIKVPEGRGFLPAFWLMADEEKYGNWPMCGTIDIMEILGSETDRFYASVHYGVSNITQQSIHKFSAGEDPVSEFHTSTCDWEPGKIRWFIDGVEFFSCTVPDLIDHPFYIVLNMAIGGNWAGDPDDTTIFDEESDMIVDYVRVYQKKDYGKIGTGKGKKRKVLGICGVWEDAENFNLFVRAMQSPEVSRDYVLAAFTFGIPNENREEIEVEKQFADFIVNIDMAAVIIFAEMIKSEEVVHKLIAGAKKHKIPAIVFERRYDDVINAELDYRSGFEGIVRHIVEHHGCRNVDMFAGFRNNPFSDERIEVYKKVLEENGIPYDPDRVHHGDFWDAIAERKMTGLIESGYPLPEAIVCANDSMAVGVCDSLKKHNIRIPDDVIVTGFDGIWQSYCHNPGITTCEPDYDDMREQIISAIDSFYDLRKQKKSYVTDLKIKYKTVIRSSCGCASETYDKWSGIVTSLYNDNHDYFRHILEMGRFISKTISMSDVVEATADLQMYLWLWRSQYYFIGIKENDNCIHAVFEGYKGLYKHDRRFFNMPAPLPEMDSILSDDSGLNVLLFKQARARSESFGYIVCGYEELSLRDEQRFEEYSLFVAAVVHSALNNRKLIAANTEIEHMSELDYLTGLYNRRGFFKNVDAALRKRENKGRYFSLFAVDMDGLKSINDNYGHFEGDAAIQSLAHAIKTFVGDRGFCARFGGDEFAFVIIGDEPLSGKTSDIRDNINRFIEAEAGLADRPYLVGASLGCAERIIEGKVEIEEVMRAADLSMYQDKYLRKGNI